MSTLHTILLSGFLLCEGLAAFWNPEPYRLRIIALGLTFFAASLLFT